MENFVKKLEVFISENHYQVYNTILEATDKKIIIERKDSFNLEISEYKIAQEYINIFAFSQQHNLHTTLLNNGGLMISHIK